VLSQKVKEIVCEQRSTTYTKVADILIKELKDSSILELDSNNL
jgi:hypothetical protein